MVPAISSSPSAADSHSGAGSRTFLPIAPQSNDHHVMPICTHSVPLLSVTLLNGLAEFWTIPLLHRSFLIK